MHKNLHKNLYSKRNKKKIYPPVNDISISPSDKVNNENYFIKFFIHPTHHLLVPLEDFLRTLAMFVQLDHLLSVPNRHQYKHLT